MFALLQSPLANAFNTDVGYLYAAAVAAAAQQVMHGFTTIRDVGGNTFGLKRAIDVGVQSVRRFRKLYLGRGDGGNRIRT